MYWTVKRVWHEDFDILILLKLADKVSLTKIINYLIHNIKKMQTCDSFRSNRRELYLGYLLWWPRFLISKQHFQSIWKTHTKVHHKGQKNMTKLLVPKSEWVWKTWGMMLWIISGPFKVYCTLLQWCGKVTCEVSYILLARRYQNNNWHVQFPVLFAL